jgi:hypothetical protein
MIFGQESNTWFTDVNCDVTPLMFKYGNLLDDWENRYYSTPSPFFQMFQWLYSKTKSMNNSTAGLIWNNVVKIGNNSGKGLPKREVVDYATSKESLISEELKICAPTYALFFSGPYYDNFIKSQLCTSDWSPVRGFNMRQMSTFKIDDTLMAIRTYHPGYLRRSGLYFRALNSIWKIVSESADE